VDDAKQLTAQNSHALRCALPLSKPVVEIKKSSGSRVLCLRLRLGNSARYDAVIDTVRMSSSLLNAAKVQDATAAARCDGFSSSHAGIALAR